MLLKNKNKKQKSIHTGFTQKEKKRRRFFSIPSGAGGAETHKETARTTTRRTVGKAD